MKGCSSKLIFIGAMLASSICIANTNPADPFAGLPAGKGQVETFAFCSACHSLMIVKQQKLSREDWQETLEWMVEEQGMDELPPEAESLVLDYLSLHFGETPSK